MRRQRSDDRGRAGGAVSSVRFRRAEKSLRRDFARRRPRFAEPESSFAEGSDTAARIGRRHPNPLFVPSFGTFFSGEVPDSRIFFLSLQVLHYFRIENFHNILPHIPAYFQAGKGNKYILLLKSYS